MNQDTTAFTVSVHPIQQEPGVWFADYMISEYRDGAECVVASVSMRHSTHRSEADARQAARHAGERAAARLRPQPPASRRAQRHDTPRGDAHATARRNNLG